jgi:autotransporter-associated beta strand protein
VNSGTNGALVDGDMGNSFLTYGIGTGLRPLDLTTEYDTIALAAPTDNARESLGADLTGLVGTTVNSLILNNTAVTGLDVTGTGALQTLAVTSGAMMFTVTGGVASTAYDTTLGGFDNGITVGGTNEYVISVVNPSSAATTSTLTATIVSPLTSTADITKSGRGTLVLNQGNTAGGGANKTTINEGTLQIADLDNIGGGTGNLVFAGGALRLGTGFTDDISTRTISFQLGGGTLDTNGNDAALINSLGSGVGAFTKIGAGNLTLNAPSTRTGATTLTTGTVTIGAANALGVGGNLSISAGATLALGANNISHGLVTTSGASPVITGTGTITASTGFFLNHTGDTAIGAVLAGAGGLLKAQTNVVTLSGLNTYTGTTEIQAGTISFDTIGNVGGGASALGAPTTIENGIIRTGLTTVAATLTYTGAGSSSDRIIEMQGTTGGLTINGNGTGALALGRIQTVVNGAKTLTLGGTSATGLVNSIATIAEVGSALSVTKSGVNTWVINGANTYTGSTTIDDGILRLNAAQNLIGALQYGSANTITTTGTLEAKEDTAFGSLLVQPNGSANLVVDPTKEVTINGNVTIGSAAASSVTNFAATGGGDFSVSNLTNTGNTFLVGGTGTANTTLADFSALPTMNVALNTTSGVLLVSSSSGTNATGKAELRLADTSVVSGSAITVGGGGTFNGNANQVNLLKLGSVSNTLNVNTVNIGTGARDLGSITFLDSSGSVTVRAADGSSAAAFNMGTGSANTSVALSGNQNTFDVTGHNADLKFSTVNIGTQNRNQDLANVFSFDTGTLEIGSLNASSKGANGFITTTTINLGGGTVTSGAWTLASASGAGSAVATANLTGGNITFSGHISRGVDAVGGGTATGTVNLNGSNLNMNGSNIGDATNQIVFNSMSGMLSGLNELNGGAALTKTTTGVLVMGAANAYTGATNVNDGTMQVGVAEVGTTGSGLVTVVKSATAYANAPVISGSGTIQGAVVIGDTVTAANKGILAPGDGNTTTSNATLTITAAGGLTVAAGSQTQLGITAASGTDAAFAASGLLASAYLAGLGSASDGTAGTAPSAWFNQTTSGQADFIKLSSGTGALVLGTNAGGATAGQGIVSIFSNGLNTGTLAAGQIFNLVDWFGAFSGGFSTGIGVSTGGVHGDFDLPDISTTTFGWDTSAFTSHGVIAVVVVPEPSRALLMLIGLLALGFRRRRIQD